MAEAKATSRAGSKLKRGRHRPLKNTSTDHLPTGGTTRDRPDNFEICRGGGEYLSVATAHSRILSSSPKQTFSDMSGCFGWTNFNKSNSLR